MARRLLFYISCEYNKGPIVTGNEYLYRPFGYKDTSHEHSRGPAITGSEYLWRPSGTSADHLNLRGR